MRLSSNPSTAGSTCTKYFNNASECAPLEIDPHSSSIHQKEQVYNVIQEIFPAFLESSTNSDGPRNHTLPIDNLIVKPLEGGLSNHLLLVTKDVPQSTPNSEVQPNYQSAILGTKYNTLLVRVYPDSDHKTDMNGSTDESPGDTPSLALVDRSVENKVSAWLASVNEAPLYFGQFRNGRLEEVSVMVKVWV